MSVVKQMFAVLIGVGLFSSVVLSASYKLTKPLIEQHKLEQLKESIFEVLPKAETYEEVSTEQLQVYKGLDEQGQPVGYAFVAKGSGFQGTIRMIVGIDQELDTLLGMRVLEQVETPGLGAKIAQETPKKDFYEQFTKLELDVDDAEPGPPPEEEDFVTYVKNEVPDEPNEIQAITGATISSKAVVEIINQSLDQLYQSVEP
jgi:Na+-translocating ferredoxin:NAD+ oxidoreductase subunit G